MGKGGNHRSTGDAYEERAAEYLKEKGYEILVRNFHSRYGELDIIAREGNMLVFAEVKYRSRAEYGYPQEMVTAKKQRSLLLTAKWYLTKQGYPEDTPCRFDVIAILGQEITHIINAFS